MQNTYVTFSPVLAVSMLAPGLVFIAQSVSHPNMRCWRSGAAGYLALLSSAALSSFAGELMPLFSILTANALAVVGYFYATQTLRLLYPGKTRFLSERTVAVGGLLTGLVNYIFKMNYLVRTIDLSVLIALFSLVMCLILIRALRGTRRLPAVELLIFSVLNMLFSGGRAAAGAVDLVGSQSGSIIFSHVDRVFMLWSIASVFTFSLGVFWEGTQQVSRRAVIDANELGRLVVLLKAAQQEQAEMQKFFAHEMKRPLNALLSFIRANSTAMPAAERETVESLTYEAVANLDHLADLDSITEIMNHPNFGALSVGQLCLDTQTKWRVATTCRDKDKSKEIYADSLLVDIAIGNLLENAFKFCHTKTEIHVTFSTTKDHLHIDVADDGEGVPAHLWSDIWKKFKKYNPGSRTEKHSYGLGLYVVQKICLLHNGRAEVVSQRPSTFRICLPLIGDSLAKRD